MSITVKIVSIKTHHSIDMMKRYHELLRRVYSIIAIEISEIDFELTLQMTFKIINDFDRTQRSNLNVTSIWDLSLNDRDKRLVVYYHSTSHCHAKRHEEVRKLNAMRQMNDVLNTRNESSITLIHDLPLNSFVLIFRKNNVDQSRSWKRSFKLLTIQNESTIVELSNKSTKFRSTSIKSYYQNDHTDDENSSSSSTFSFSVFTSNMPSFIESQNDFIIDPILSQSPNTISLTESQNKPFTIDSIIRIEPVKRGRERSRKYFASAAYLNFILNSITSLDSSFIASRQQKIAELLEKDVFLSINKIDISSDVRIFSFRFVNEIKHSDTDKTFKKFRLVVQAFKNRNKTLVLTQSSII